MRIVGGSARGRRLESPRGTTARPTSDRVRESLFNMLFSMDDVVAGATVLDAFAGTGALGLEALSRGASHASFVEQHRDTLSLLRRNIETLGFAPQARVIAGDTMRLAATLAPVDIAFLDPPYDFDRWGELLALLRARIAVIESNRRVVPSDDRWELARERRYGSTVVQIYTAR